MPEQSKFAGALGKLKQPNAKPDKRPNRIPEAPRPEPTAKAGRGGKRSNPDYSPTTFFVRKDTKRRAARLLEDTNADQDLSDLVEHLLARWISEQANV